MHEERLAPRHDISAEWAKPESESLPDSDRIERRRRVQRLRRRNRCDDDGEEDPEEGNEGEGEASTLLHWQSALAPRPRPSSINEYMSDPPQLPPLPPRTPVREAWALRLPLS